MPSFQSVPPSVLNGLGFFPTGRLAELGTGDSHRCVLSAHVSGDGASRLAHSGGGCDVEDALSLLLPPVGS